MRVFNLTRYEGEEKPSAQTQPEVAGKEAQPTASTGNVKTLNIKVGASLAETVATLLYEQLDKKTEVKELAPGSASETSDVTVLSAEDINLTPEVSLKAARSAGLLFLYAPEGFKSRTHDWFLTNAFEGRDVANEVVYTHQGFLSLVCAKLGVGGVHA